MKNSVPLVVFTLDDQNYALPLEAVERIVLAVEVIPLPKAPEIIVGVINVRGVIIPVVNIRRRFRIPEREPSPADKFVIAKAARRMVALVADSVLKVVDVSEDDIIAPKDIVPGTSYLDGIVRLEDGIVLIHDLDKFLSLEEEAMLDETLSQSQA
jgi:purine-binding chemotaxis protein CheW